MAAPTRGAAPCPPSPPGCTPTSQGAPMSRIARRLLPFVAAVAAASLAAVPAFASGGPPAPEPTIGSYCPSDSAGWVYSLPDGSTVFANEASGGGCVFVRSYPAGYLRLDHVD